MGMFDSIKIEGNLLPTHPILEKYGINPNELMYQHKNADWPEMDVQIIKKVGDAIQLWWIGTDCNGGFFPPESYDELYCKFKEPTLLSDITYKGFGFYDYIYLPLGCSSLTQKGSISLGYECDIEDGIITNLKLDYVNDPLEDKNDR